ncbi:hypothetical protein VNI00_008942 [Paramarasmius palmivorus]|uniref:Protein kinase domain-containing protein n=1 Tax=Paramarasmius palmivorus TaxID=297713 RepID=A0AAW0CU92_9AGAR
MRILDEKVLFTPSLEGSSLNADDDIPSFSTGKKVAVKVHRSATLSEETKEKMRKKLSRELEIQRKSEYPNVLSLYGIVSDFGPYDSIVCPWHENGSVDYSCYVKLRKGLAV